MDRVTKFSVVYKSRTCWHLSFLVHWSDKEESDPMLQDILSLISLLKHQCLQCKPKLCTHMCRKYSL